MTTQSTGASLPSRSAMFDRISAVQQTIGASRLTAASPVIRPTLVGAEVAAEREELLADERLDGRRVVAALALAHREEVQGQRDERLPAPGRRGEDDVVAREELEDRLLLRRVELEAQLGNVPEEQVEELFGGRPRSRRDSIGKRHRPMP